MSDSQNPPEEGTAKPLTASINDGIYHAIMLGAGESYLGAFGIFLRATTLQIGLLAALPLLCEAISQWISALSLDRFQSRKNIIFFWSLFQGAIWLPVALLPFLFGPGNFGTISLICLVTINHIATGFIYPVWSSLMGDLVPIKIRGRFFGNRNRLTGMSSFISLLLAGSILHFFKNAEQAALGFLVIFIIAMLARFCSAFWIHRYDDPPYRVQPEDVFSFWQFLRRAPKSNYAKFSFFFAITNFSVSFSSPYFALYMLRDLNFSYFEFTAISGLATLFQFLTFRYWGEISDRFGNKKILTLCGFGIAIVPICWVFSENIIYICSIQIFAGAVWAGFNLAAANFIYDACSPPKRARCVAYRGVINGFFVLAGSMSGGVVAKLLPPDFSIGPFHFSHALLFVFLVSGLLRLMTATFFLKIFHEVREVEPIRSRELIFRVSHIKPIAGATFNLMTYFFRDQKQHTEKDKKLIE
nr:MFS transporter [Desulfobulbaceae bacterium]